MVTGVAAIPVGASRAADPGLRGPVPARTFWAGYRGPVADGRPAWPVLAAPAAAEVGSGWGRHCAADQVLPGLPAAGHLALTSRVWVPLPAEHAHASLPVCPSRMFLATLACGVRRHRG